MTDDERKQEIQKHFNNFKKRLKPKSKSELIAILWQMGIEQQELKQYCKELISENKRLSPQEPVDEENKETN